MSKPKLLWVNVGVTGPKDASAIEFARDFHVQEIVGTDLCAADLAGDWGVVCFDFDYPDMASLRLIPESKCRWPSSPILMLTLQNSAELAMWALRSQVFDLLVKPASPDEVAQCLRRVKGALRARRSQSERTSHAVAAKLPSETRYRPQLSASSRVRAAIAHVAKNYEREISEANVASLVETSPSQFCREFKAACGMTFLEYVCAHRVMQAKRLLANPSISITDVAAAVGFGDPSYFTRVFRKLEGCRPSEYRRSLPDATESISACVPVAMA